MHFLLSALGSAGDVHPIAGLAAGLRQRGHRVTVVTNPLFEDLIRRLDLEFEPLGTREEFLQVQQNPDLWHPWRGFRTVVEFGIARAIRDIYHIVEKHAAAGELVVAGHSLDLGSRLAQEKLGVPMVTLHLSPAVFRSQFVPPVLMPGLMGPRSPRWLLRAIYYLADKWLADPLIGAPLNRFRAELGLPPVTRVLDAWWYSPQLVLGLFPAWFGPPQPDWPKQVELTGFPLWDEDTLVPDQPEVEQFLQSGPPPIVFTPGSAMVHGREFFLAAVDACRRLGARAVLLTRHAEQLPTTLPPDVVHFPFVPFGRILPRSAAVVHHGGIGSVAQGLAAAIPQLIMPMAHDQHDNAARAVRLGAADILRPRAFRGPAVARKLAQLIDSNPVRDACLEVRRHFEGTDPIGAACDALERVAEAAYTGQT